MRYTVPELQRLCARSDIQDVGDLTPMEVEALTTMERREAEREKVRASRLAASWLGNEKPHLQPHQQFRLAPAPEMSRNCDHCGTKVPAPQYLNTDLVSSDGRPFCCLTCVNESALLDQLALEAGERYVRKSLGIDE